MKLLKKYMSRKFIITVTVLIVMIMFAAGVDANVVERAIAMIVVCIDVATYILGEAAIDAKGIKTAEIESELARISALAGQIARLLNTSEVSDDGEDLT